MKNLIALCIVFVLPFIGNSQKSFVSGNVSDSNLPLPGVNVVIKGTAKGTQTDFEGNFKIEVSKGQILVFSFIGYKDHYVTIEEPEKFLTIELVEDLKLLEEVVITGYGSRKSRDAVGYSVSDYGEGGASGSKSYGNYPYGVLTAGEINDIKDYSEWLSVLKQKKFKKIQQDWGFYLEHKIEVMVKDNDGEPINNVKVVLFAEKEAGIKAEMVSRTDVTGKSVLFRDLNCSTIEEYYYVQVFHNDKILGRKVKTSTKELAFTFSKQTESKNVDIMFTIDATGSMGDEMNYLKAELQNIISRVDQNIGEKRVALTFYRDVSDEYTVREFDFNSDIKKVQAFLDKQYATGGGDYEEAVEVALKESLLNNWDEEARAKLMFLLLDAPPHWNEQNVMTIRNEIRKAQEMGIKIIPIVASGADKTVEFLMRFFSVSTNGTYVFLTDDSGIGNPHLKPTKSNYKVEKLNNLIVRLINEYAMI
ncbi:vWA domain-containing protein [Flagellimonas meridianipacifica]|uniref:von Willebrand factor type A domain-containing protein n=1 Tax=Flagellimonas meridianipacifica TaxID=1080225 RepID=A0A2T0MCE5_9FLAO|nr:vWA domain-containing protein [Allomuricauda pacifica]PRX55166.1 von Willebrand factor type A domain-containing protein [Allomuricauda pacifica]